MSQRLAFTLFIFVVFVVVSIMAFAQGHTLIVNGDTLNDQILSLIVPFTAIMTTVWMFLKVLDARVASGELQPGDIISLLGMSEFWVSFFSVLAGVLQLWGYEFINPDTQAALVSAALIFSTILLHSFAERAPKDPLPTAQKVQVVLGEGNAGY